MINETVLQYLYPYYLYGLIPLLFLFFLRRKEGSIGSITFSSLAILKRFGKKPAGRIGFISLTLIVLSLATGIIALSRPQLVNEREFTKTSGIDIMIDFDLSGSMEMADMVVNNYRVSRLDAAKYVIREFIKGRPNDRFGIVGFAGKPKIFSPLTLDHFLVESHIKDFDPRMMNEDGTAIGSAIAAACTRLEERKDTKSKIIILVTDGASNSGELTPIEAAQLAAKLNIKIYTIAIGTESGRLQGAAARQEFDEETLIEIARITKGEHFRAKTTKMFVDAFSSIDALEKSEAQKHIIRKVKELFPIFSAFAVLFAILGIFTAIVRPRPAP